MFASELPTEHHLPALVHKLAKERSIPLALPPRSREVLLGRPDHTKASNAQGCVTHDSIKAATNEQGSKQSHHKHLATCHEGYHGQKGCRLCMKCGRCNETGCVLLEELPVDDGSNSVHRETDNSILNDLRQHAAENRMYGYDDDGIDDDYDQCEDFRDFRESCDDSATDNSYDNEPADKNFICEDNGKKIEVAYRATKTVPAALSPQTYLVLNILKKAPPPPLIVWETSRRTPNETLPTPDSTARSSFSCADILDSLNTHLGTLKEFDGNHCIWAQLHAMSDSALEDFYLKLASLLKTANQYIAAYNPSISYCTGAHNNAVLLGGDEQAKAATFYLCPYISKLKFPLRDCLVILEKALEHTRKHESVAPDSGTDKRTSMHILQRCLTKLNLKMELSGKHLFEQPPTSRRPSINRPVHSLLSRFFLY